MGIEALQDKINYQVPFTEPSASYIRDAKLEELTTKEKEFLLDILYKNVDWTCTQIRDGIIKKLHLTSQET